MKRILPVLLVPGLLLLMLAVSGCEDSDHYSLAVQYGVRTDPLVVVAKGGDLGADVEEPDRPGLLPISKPKDVLLPASPLAAKGQELFTSLFLRDPMQIPDEFRKELDKVLVDFFGTPLDPKLKIEADALQKLKIDDKGLKEGSRLYRIHCVHCHGVPGDGHGPTGRWISPHPRDFRQGLFKFMSIDQNRVDKSGRTKSNRPPRRDDLYHTLRYGIEGTAMPSFVLLKPAELNDLVSYVIHLSVRGKAEYDFITESFEWKKNGNNVVAAPGGGMKVQEVKENVQAFVDLNVPRWVDSQDPKEAIEIPEYDWKFKGEDKVWQGMDEAKKWKVRGAMALALFTKVPPTMPEAKQILELRGDKPENVDCKQCHTDFGRQSMFKFDLWGTLVRPNNFTLGVFRGGRRPADIYHRIHSGINGSGMTPFGDPKTLSSNGIWDMVEFVQALSYPSMRNKLGVNID